MILDTSALSAWAEGRAAIEAHLHLARLELKRAGHPIPASDVRVAALARQHTLAILSNDSHFDVVDGVRRIAL